MLIQLMGFNKNSDRPLILQKDKIPLLVPKGVGYTINLRER